MDVVCTNLHVAAASHFFIVKNYFIILCILYLISLSLSLFFSP